MTEENIEFEMTLRHQAKMKEEAENTWNYFKEKEKKVSESKEKFSLDEPIED